MRTDYSVSVKEVSKELTHKERVQITDLTDCVKLDTATQEGPVLIDLDYYAVLAIHNEKSTDKDYENYVVADKNGIRYSTGSKSFFNNLVTICEEMQDSDDPDEMWQIKAYRRPSKNRQGKDFITCSIV